MKRLILTCCLLAALFCNAKKVEPRKAGGGGTLDIVIEGWVLITTADPDDQIELIEVYDSHEQLVMKEACGCGKSYLYLNGLSSGNYYVYVQEEKGSGSFTFKI